MGWRKGGPRPSLSSTSFQVLSDLHLEIGQQYRDFLIPVAAPYLILAGDIGRLRDVEHYSDFLSYHCTLFQKVYLVLGNHEFFGVTRREGLRIAAELEQDPRMAGRLLILNRTREDVSRNITILGCTLQSNIPPDTQEIVRAKVADFKRIEGWTIENHNNEHVADVAWLRQEIAAIRAAEKERLEHGPRRTILVVTHHAPSRRGTSDPRNENNPWSTAFATDLLSSSSEERISELDDVQWWVFGHTHYCTEKTLRTVRMFSNQRGYIFPLHQDKDANSIRAASSLRPTNGLKYLSNRLSSFVEFQTMFPFIHKATNDTFDVRRCIRI